MGSSSPVNFQGTRKIGGKAHIAVHSITVYNDFQLNKEETNLGSRKMKEKKKEKLQEHYQVLNKNQHVNTKIKYYVLLPDEEAHHASNPWSYKHLMPKEYIRS